MWLTEELAKSKEKGAGHTIVFQHIPWFWKTPGINLTQINQKKTKKYFYIWNSVNKIKDNQIFVRGHGNYPEARGS